VKKPGRPARKQIKDGFAPTQALLAQACELSLRALQNALKLFWKDTPKFHRGIGYSISETKEWLARHGVIARRKQDELADERAVKLAHANLRLERERFEFEQIKDRMLPAGQFEAALAKTLSAFLAALNAFGPRINEKLEGLDFNDRALVIESEIIIIRRTLATCDYLGSGEEEEDDE
jgi:hypothetical protein